MTQLVDSKTNAVVDLSPQEATQALLNGTHELQQTDTGKITLVSPKGQTFEGPTQNAYSLLQKGWTLPSVKQQATADVAKEAKESPVMAPIAQGLESFTNQALFGVPGIIQEHSGDEYAQEHQKAEEAAHPYARGIGGVAGFGASMLYGGELFQGASKAGKAVEGAVAGTEAGLGTKLLGKALGGATEGAIVSAPQTITEAAVGDKQKAAESLALGAGFGGLLGFGGGVFDELKGAIKMSAQDAEPTGLLDALQSKADTAANKDALRLAGMQKSQLKHIPEEDRQALGNLLFEKGLIKPGMSKEDIASAIKDFHETSGEAVRSHLTKLDDVLSAKPELQELGFNPQRTADRLRSELGGGLDVPMYEPEQKELAKIADSVEAMGKDGVGANGSVDFRTAQDVKNMFSKFKWNKINPSEKEQLQQKAYGIVRDEMDKSAEGIAAASGDDDLYQSYMGAKKDFQNASTLLPGADNLMAMEGGNRKFGLSDFIVGHGAGMMTAASHAVLGPLGAPAAFLGSIFLKHLAENQGNILSASALKRFASADLSKLGVMSALEGSAAIDSKLASGLKDTLKGVAVSGLQRTDPLSMLLGQHATGLSKGQQFDKVSQAINQSLTNPETLAENINAITSAIHHTGAPETAKALGDQYTKTAQYMQTSLPKPPPPNPFVKQEWKPTPAQINDFHDKMAVVQNPFIVLDHLAKGTLTAGHVDALQKVYPSIAQQLQETAITAASEKDSSVPFSVRLKLSLLMGKPCDPSLMHIASLQSVYAPAQPQQGGSTTGGKGHKIKNLPSATTEIQRVTAGEKA